MPLETDLNRIREMAAERDEENWQFRCFLKQCDIPSSRIDRLTRTLYQEISARIDCTQCANCCRALSPVLKPVDIQRLAARLKMTPDQFRSQYLKEDVEDDGWAFTAMPCAFLCDNRCTVYEDRPQVCRGYPYLEKREFVSRSLRVLANIAVCPIVFNVYEALKDELWRQAPGS